LEHYLTLPAQLHHIDSTAKGRHTSISNDIYITK
jgi:hypothetical protein